MGTVRAEEEVDENPDSEFWRADTKELYIFAFFALETGGGGLNDSFRGKGYRRGRANNTQSTLR